MIQTKKVLKRRLKMLTKRYLILVGWLKRLITTQKLQRLKTRYLVLIAFTQQGQNQIHWIMSIFFYVGVLSWIFTNHRTAQEEEGHFIISLLPLHSLLRHLDINQAITTESSPLHIVNSWTWPRNLQFMGTSH